ERVSAGLGTLDGLEGAPVPAGGAPLKTRLNLHTLPILGGGHANVGVLKRVHLGVPRARRYGIAALLLEDRAPRLAGKSITHDAVVQRVARLPRRRAHAVNDGHLE